MTLIERAPLQQDQNVLRAHFRSAFGHKIVAINDKMYVLRITLQGTKIRVPESACITIGFYPDALSTLLLTARLFRVLPKCAAYWDTQASKDGVLEEFLSECVAAAGLDKRQAWIGAIPAPVGSA